MASTIFDQMYPMLCQFDVLGASGCDIPKPRCNLLVQFRNIQFDDIAIRLGFDQFSPEGWGVGHFFRDSLVVPGDAILNENQTLIWDIQQALPPCQEKMWVFNVLESAPGVFHYDEQSFWQAIDETSCNHRPIHALELFGGGMGGWKAAGKFLSSAFQQRWETVAVEQQLDIAKCYAITHDTGLLTNAKNLPRDFISKRSNNWIICADICDSTWYPMIAEWGVDAVLLSPPCQPWSKASTSPGLDRVDGTLTAYGLLLCRWFRPQYVALEQVIGFQSHPHKPIVLRILKWLGYQVLFEKVVDLSDQSLSHRQRFLLVAVRVHSGVTSTPFKGWFRQDFTQHPLLCRIRLPQDIHKQLQPGSKTISMASNPEFSKGLGSFSSERVLASRITHDGQCTPTFMAKYGSQHEIDASFLKSHGYFGHFVHTGDGNPDFRFWHPAEIAIIHGIVQATFLPADITLAWHIVGNQICLPHALLVVADLFHPLHHFDYSPFVVFSQFQQMRFQGPQVHLVSFPGGYFIDVKDDIPIPPTVHELIQCVENSTFFECWTSGCGFMMPPTIDCKIHDTMEVEEVSQATISPTLDFAICVHARFEGEHTFQFWCDASVSCQSLEDLWFNHVRCTYPETSEPGQPSILVTPSFQRESTNEAPWEVVTVFIDHQLTLWSIPADQNLRDFEKIQAIGDQLFDQFGPIGPHQKTRFGIVVLPTQVVVEPTPVEVLYLFAAFRETNIEMHWDVSLQCHILALDGDASGVSLLIEFWTSLFSRSQLETFGFRCQTESSPGYIRFVPIDGCATIPPAAFHLALGLAAVRTIFTAIPVTWPVQVRLTWCSRPLWIGPISADCTAQLIVNVVRMGLGNIRQIHRFHLVHRGQRVDPATTLQQMNAPETEEIVLHVVPGLHGGGPSKQQQKILAKNAIASILLEHGLEIGWVKQTVEQLHDQCGIPKLQQILIGPTFNQKLKDIKQACLELGIQFPVQTAPSNQANLLSTQKNKRRKESQLSITPSDYKVDTTFFHTNDKQPAVQLNQLRANASGFCLVLPAEAIPWLRANQAISADELGAIVLGKIPVETNLPAEPVTMPCTDHAGQSVLLSGTLIQLGSKPLQFAKGDPKQVDAVTGHLMAITLFKEDWSPDRWLDATANPLAFVARALEQENMKDSVQAMWGRSLRAGRAQATPAQATTVQIHCTVVDTKKDQLLRASGLNALFFTPKTRAGRVDPSYKIIWIEGDIAQATGLATQTPHCLGLVRGRSPFGLRFLEDKYMEAWTKIHPGLTPPPRSAGALTFKIEGLPFGCTADMLTSWGAKISWKIVPFKALGPSAWLVKSDNQMPSGLLHFNTAPVLVRFLPPKDVDKTPLLVGPRPKHAPQQKDTTMPNFGDPWANYTGPRLQSSPSPAPPARTLDGPVASRMKEQDEKIATLQSDLKRLSLQSEKQFAVMDKRLDSSEKHHAAQFGKMEASISALSSNIDQALETSVQKNAKLMEQKMNELKALFQTKRPRDDDPME